MNADLVIAWAKVILSGAVTVALIPLALYVAKYYWDVRRWRAFERLIEEWSQCEFAVDTLSDDDWRAVAAIKLYDAGFEPARLVELIDLAVWFAKGKASQGTFGKIGFRENGDEHGPPDGTKPSH